MPVIHMRISDAEKKLLTRLTREAGFKKNFSAFIRHKFGLPPAIMGRPKKRHPRKR